MVEYKFNRGDLVWYRNNVSENWEKGMIDFLGERHNEPIYGVTLEDGTEKWGYEEQFQIRYDWEK